jgi:hypothetical protein
MRAQTNMVAFGRSTGQPASMRPSQRQSRRRWYMSRISATHCCEDSSAWMAATWIGVKVP